MAPHLRASMGFGLLSLVASVPVVAFFWQLGVPGNALGAWLWPTMPVLAIVLSTASAYLVMNLAATPRFGPWQGGIAALVALVACAAIAAPFLVLPALLFVAWFVVPLGALGGFLIHRFVLHPNPTPHTDARDLPAPAKDNGAHAGGRER